MAVKVMDVLVGAAVMVLVSLATPAPEESVTEAYDAVRTGA